MSSYVPLGTDPDDDALRTSGSPEEISVSTASVTVVGTKHHMLKVGRYKELIKATNAGKNGGYIESSFNVGGHAWSIRLYLNGAKEEDAGFVSLHLFLSGASAGTVVQADFELALVHHLGTLVRRPASYAVSAIRPFSPEASWGWPRFISVEHLESSVFLRDGCFAVRCRVTVLEDKPSVKKEVVTAQDVQRLGLLCGCNDNSTCKRHHATPAQTLCEEFARMCRSMLG